MAKTGSLLPTVAILAALTACGGTTAPHPSSPPSGSASAVATATAPATTYPSSSLPVLFQDSMVGSSNWPQRDVTVGGAKVGTSQIIDTGYQVQIVPSGGEVFDGPTRVFGGADQSVEVDVHKLAGPVNGEGFGVICRFDGNGVYYRGTISGDGHYSIRKSVSVAAPEEILMHSNSSVIRTGLVTNHVRVDCVGSTITLYVNGQQLAQVQNTTIKDAGRGGGVIVNSSAAPEGTKVVFTNFVLRGTGGGPIDGNPTDRSTPVG